MPVTDPSVVPSAAHTSGYLSFLGPFRISLAVMSTILIVSAPFALGESQIEDWRIIPTVIAPVLAVVMLFLLPLDMLMSWVFAVGDHARRKRMRKVIIAELAMLTLLALAWTPFIMGLFPD